MAQTPADWMTRLVEEMRLLTEEAARAVWPGPTPSSPPWFNYRYEHVRQVDRYARILLDRVGGDRDIVLAGVWIHDRFKPLFDGPEHGLEAAAWVESDFPAYGFPPEKLESLAFAVANHVGWIAPHDVIPEERPEARILWDADKLDKFGLHAVTYFHLAHAVFKPRVLTHEKSARPLRPLPTEEELRAWYFYPQSFEIARTNLERERRFFEELGEELGAAERKVRSEE